MPKDTSDLPKSIKKALKYDLMKLTKRGLSFNMASQTLNSEGGQSLANLIGKRRIENTFRGFQVIFQDKDTILWLLNLQARTPMGSRIETVS